MRRFLVTTAFLGALALGTASVAAAMPKLDPNTLEGFVSRGDVIKYAGADALGPDVIFALQWQVTWAIDCTAPDGSTTSPSVAAGFSQGMLEPDVEMAANGTIVGYRLPGAFVFNDGPPDLPNITCPEGTQQTRGIYVASTSPKQLWLFPRNGQPAVVLPYITPGD